MLQCLQDHTFVFLIHASPLPCHTKDGEEIYVFILWRHMSRQNPNPLEEDKVTTLQLIEQCAFDYGILNTNRIFLTLFFISI